MKKLSVLLTVFILCAGTAGTVYGFGNVAGACEKDCLKCHTLTKEDASQVLKSLNPAFEVMNVQLSPVRGLWEIDFKIQGKPGVVYIDFSKAHLVQGPILDVKGRTDLTSQRLQEISRVDVSKIPLKEALVLGNRSAKYKVIVFDDPD